ncbi:MAG: 4Fe-4S binding protein [Coriobacteriales bacterium]|nr:4Fe-4S binding protein [Coriobacteriales bacterium]
MDYNRYPSPDGARTASSRGHRLNAGATGAPAEGQQKGGNVAVSINEDSECLACAACMGACPNEVLEFVDGSSAVVNPDECIECGMCVDACPVERLEL